jgi:His/Glu/Gln/Arg/opine family amino acid ABC transporter permease subunit
MFSWLTPDILHLLWLGFLLTLVLTAVTSLLSFVMGILIGVMRLERRRLWRGVAAVYVDFFRNVPALVLIIFWAFAVPNLFPRETRQALFFNNSFMGWLTAVTGLALPYYFLATTLALTLNTSAYLAELFRAGVGTIPQEHIDAARSLGATPWAIFWQIMLPQGVRAAFPAISTRLIHNMKNTALAAFVSVPEFFQQTQTAVSRTFFAVEFLSLAAIVYLALSLSLAGILHRLEKHLNQKKEREDWNLVISYSPITDL